MANHSSNLAWRIPWTEETGRVQSMGSQNQTGLKRLSTRAHSKYFTCVNSFNLETASGRYYDSHHFTE